MPLISCKECGKPISSKAKTCPSCGAPSPVEQRNQLISGYVGLVVLVALAFWWTYSNHPEWIGLKKKTAADRMMESMQESIDSMKEHAKKR